MFYWESSACTSPSANLTALTRMERGGFSQPFSQRRSLIDLSSLTCTDSTFMCFMIKILTSVTALLALFQVGTFLTALSGIVYICSFTKSSAIFLFTVLAYFTSRFLLLQCLRLGWLTTFRLVFTITHTGTRVFCLCAFARRIFCPFML